MVSRGVSGGQSVCGQGAISVGMAGGSAQYRCTPACPDHSPALLWCILTNNTYLIGNSPRGPIKDINVVTFQTGGVTCHCLSMRQSAFNQGTVARNILFVHGMRFRLTLRGPCSSPVHVENYF